MGCIYITDKIEKNQMACQILTVSTMIYKYNVEI